MTKFAPIIKGILADPAPLDVPPGPEGTEAVGGTTSYLDVLKRIHDRLAPELYVEIGVRTGKSLRIAACPSIGIDPDCDLRFPLPDKVLVFELTSDDFFEAEATEALTRKIDFSFIDGMHLFEYTLRDFMYIESWAQANTLIVIDDVLPNHALQASRQRKTRVWTGDVWKLYYCLREYRPELTLLVLDTIPTGLLLVAGLDPNNRVLWNDYNRIVAEFNDEKRFETVPDDIIKRKPAVSPNDPLVGRLLMTLKSGRDDGDSTTETRVRLNTQTESMPNRALIHAVGRAPPAAQRLTDIAREGNAKSAIALLQAALEFDPGHAGALVAMAWRRYETGELDNALSFARRGRDAEPSWAESAVALGWFLLESGDHDRAYVALHEALTLDPQHAAAHWYLGTLLYRQDRLPEAEVLLRKALRINPQLDEARVTLAWLLHDVGRLGDALEQCRIAISHGETQRRLALLGWLIAERGEEETAVPVLRKAVELAPTDIPILGKLISVLSRCGRHTETMALLRQGLALTPGNPELLMFLGWIHHDRGQIEAARAVALDLTERHPALGGGWQLLGSTWEMAGDLEQADACFARAQALQPDNTELVVSRAGLKHRMGRSDEAAELLQILLDADPEVPSARLLLAQLWLDKGLFDAARRLLHQLLSDRAHAADTWRLLAIALSQKKRPNIARYAVRRALHHAPDSIETLRLAGWLNLKTGDFEEAREASRALLALLPDDPTALTQAAVIAQAAGDPVTASHYAERSVFLAPDNAECWWRLGEVRHCQRHWKEAEACLETALRLDPDRPEILRLLGWVLVGQDRLKEAETACHNACNAEPEIADYRLALAEVQSLAGRFSEAVETISMAQALKPDRTDTERLLARCRFEQGLAESPQRRGDYWSEATVGLAELLRDAPHDRETVSTLLRLAAAGNTTARAAIRLIPKHQRQTYLREILEWAVHHVGSAECVELAGLAQGEFPNDPNIVCAATYITASTGALPHDELSRRIRIWGRNLALTEGMLVPRPVRTQRAGRRLRVAYIASHLHSSLLLDVIGAHDRTRIELFLYVPVDEMAGAEAHLRGAAVVQLLSATDLAESLCANGMDVVVDTAGLHPFHGQLEVLRAMCRRVAPVQCGWLGTWGSGGGIYDALVVDEQTLPSDMESLYDEEIIRIPGGQWSWSPPRQVPAPGPPPCRARGHITFASTVRGFRLSRQVLETWAELLATVPDARLELMGTHARDWRQRAEFSAILQVHGIEPARIGYRYRLPYAEHLEFFRNVDIYLDAFPGNGGLCSLDALWMGIPVVSRTPPAGDHRWVCEGQGLSVLHAIGHAGWVCDSNQAYVRIATGLAADWTALGQFRATLRQRLLASPLVDARRVAAALEAAWEGLHRQAAGIEAAQDIKSRARALAQRWLRNWLRRDRSLALPYTAEPSVSIVIVLYNQAGLTLQALDALLEQRSVAFETIIVDNGSSDETHSLLQRIEGARIVRNRENRGFLHAANQGGAMARGRHILFLNNDVILQEGALQAAVNRLESAADIGVVGGRIVLADGRLQEAGCIAFGDGWTIGYGRGEDPNGPEYRFVRDIDFCSGAFLLVRGELWRMLDGFDPVYAPAYYEDTDFCLRAWASGYRVVYEPAAVMLHVEGGSATAGEPQALMQRNHTTFLQRHGHHLAQRPDSRTAGLSIVRWAARPRPRILVVDDAVPHAVAGSGFVRARLLVQALDRHHITLFPMWDRESDWRTTYASLPETVEVMLGEGRDGFAAFLKNRAGVYDVLLVSRPPNMAFIEGLRSAQPDLFHGIRILYDSEAVFAVRDIAKAAVRGKPLPQAEQLRRIREELDQAHHADRVLAVSQRDADLFRQAGFPDVRIAAHSVTPRTTSPGVEGRSGMLFVGVLHPDTPNEDGLTWFVHEVMPRIRDRLPGGLVLSVVGECRSNAIAALDSPEVRILGRVEDLTPLYDTARLFVAPVRYAAGVPAKVIEAAGNGLPVVASAVLARQLGWTSGSELVAARNSDEFAAAIVRLAGDDDLWQRLRRGMFARTGEQFDPELFAATVRGAVTFS